MSSMLRLLVLSAAVLLVPHARADLEGLLREVQTQLDGEAVQRTQRLSRFQTDRSEAERRLRAVNAELEAERALGVPGPVVGRRAGHHEELPELLLGGHAAEQVGDALVDGAVGVVVGLARGACGVRGEGEQQGHGQDSHSAGSVRTTISSVKIQAGPPDPLCQVGQVCRLVAVTRT